MPQRTRPTPARDDASVPAPPPQPVGQVQRRRALPAEAPFPRGATLELARVWPATGAKVSSRRRRPVAAGPEAVSLTAPVGAALRRPPDIAAEAVPRTSGRELDPSVRAGAAGHRPLHLPVHFKPAGLRRGRSVEPHEGTGRRGGAIFPPEDRYIYEDAAFPWCTVGLVETEDGWGSGTMIGRRLMLTASHVVVWKPGAAGWMRFTPAAYGTDQPFGQAWGERVIFWKRNGKRMNDDETAFDYAVVVLDRPLGELTGYAGYRTFDQSWVGASYWQNLGYPGDIGGGTKPSFSGSGAISSVAPFTAQSQTAYLLGNFIDYQPGQSGGPYWGWWSGEPWPRVVGTASTLPDVPSPDTSGDNEGGGGPALSCAHRLRPGPVPLRRRGRWGAGALSRGGAASPGQLSRRTSPIPSTHGAAASSRRSRSARPGTGRGGPRAQGNETTRAVNRQPSAPRTSSSSYQPTRSNTDVPSSASFTSSRVQR